MTVVTDVRIDTVRDLDRLTDEIETPHRLLGLTASATLRRIGFFTTQGDRRGMHAMSGGRGGTGITPELSSPWCSWRLHLLDAMLRLDGEPTCPEDDFRTGSTQCRRVQFVDDGGQWLKPGQHQGAVRIARQQDVDVLRACPWASVMFIIPA